MISGLFDPRRPPHAYVDVRVGVESAPTTQGSVRFIIDTGSVHSCIHPIDANLRLKIPKSRLRDRSQWSRTIGAAGVGGPVRYFVEPATLTFTNDDGSPESIATDIWIAEMTLANQRLPSLLGWDVLRYFRLVTDGITVTLERLPVD